MSVSNARLRLAQRFVTGIPADPEERNDGTGSAMAAFTSARLASPGSEIGMLGILPAGRTVR